MFKGTVKDNPIFTVVMHHMVRDVPRLCTFVSFFWSDLSHITSHIQLLDLSTVSFSFRLSSVPSERVFSEVGAIYENK